MINWVFPPVLLEHVDPKAAKAPIWLSHVEGALQPKTRCSRKFEVVGGLIKPVEDMP